MGQLRLQFTHSKLSTLKATRICWQQWSLSLLIEHKLYLKTEWTEELQLLHFQSEFTALRADLS